jgi:hypothetical protein
MLRPSARKPRREEANMTNDDIAKRDAVAMKALVESLASAIEEGGDDLVAFIGDQIHEFNKYVCEGDDAAEIRKAA